MVCVREVGGAVMNKGTVRVTFAGRFEWRLNACLSDVLRPMPFAGGGCGCADVA